MICSATTHTGARCTSQAAEGATQCAHHARMARVMALAPKNSVSAPAAAPSSSLPASTPVRPAPAPSVQPTAFANSSLLQTTIATNARSAQRPLTADSVGSSSVAAAAAAPWMLPGESVQARVGCSFTFPLPLSLPDVPITLFVTNFRLRAEPVNAAFRAPGMLHPVLDAALKGIPTACVCKLSYPQATGTAKRSAYDSAMPTQLVVKFKDLRAWMLSGDVQTLMVTLNRYVFMDSPLSLFAFVALPRGQEQDHQLGHAIYNLHSDFMRMGVDLATGAAYRITDVNRNYAMCPTYPPQLVVPSSLSDSEIMSVAEFRSKGRLPICCFVHPQNTASIWRCAQPKRGILNTQHANDERYLAHLFYSNRTQQKVWIADCRPELNARVNNLTGGGTESSSIPHARVTFLNIANIHAMRESFENLRGLVLTPNQDLDLNWNARVEDTKWLYHVRLVVSAAWKVADAVANKQTTVLVHCSDGWDRTGQLCALSQIFLDKHYRTLTGFMQIIEKEWVRVGHKFHDRVGPGKTQNDEQAPIFLQFLDATWQVWRQYPTYFEFNEKLLETIADALFSGHFGTFLGNCDRERAAWNLVGRTPSLWAHILQDRHLYENPFYREQSENTLLPPASSLVRQVCLWTGYYFRGATLSTTPMANPSPPQWAPMGLDAPAASTYEDLSAAMTAAAKRIEELETQLQRYKTTHSSVPTPAPQPAYSPAPAYALAPTPAYTTPAPTPTYVPAPTPTPALAPTYAPTYSTGQYTASTPSPAPQDFMNVATLRLAAENLASEIPSSSSSSSSTGAASGGTWTCGICSKLNLSETPKCVVCGRLPPSP